MQESAEIRFARDGSRHIAFQVFGSGSLDLLMFSSAAIPIESGRGALARPVPSAIVQFQPRDPVFATVLFTDIVESTSRLAALGERAWSNLHDRHDEAVRRELRRFGGREVATTGDGILATFDNPTCALACGRAIRDTAAPLGLALRVGLHTGQVQVRGADVGGLAVHIAARVQALAAPHQVLVTRTLADIVVGSGFAFKDAGEHTLKGVPGRWALFALEAGPASQA
jgi:class 3 adenylate cyclase